MLALDKNFKMNFLFIAVDSLSSNFALCYDDGDLIRLFLSGIYLIETLTLTLILKIY